MEKIRQTVFERLPCNSFDNFELNSVRNRQALWTGVNVQCQSQSESRAGWNQILWLYNRPRAAKAVNFNHQLPMMING